MTKIFTAPIFPTGVIAIADADRRYSEDFDKNNFEFDDKWDFVTKQRSNKFESVLDHPSLTDMKSWIVKTASQFLKYTIKLKHKKLFITDSWININNFLKTHIIIQLIQVLWSFNLLLHGNWRILHVKHLFS